MPREVKPGARCRASECLNGTNSVRKMFKLNEFSRRCFRAPSEVTIQRRRVGRGGHPGQPDVRDGNAREVGTPGQRWGDFGGVQGPPGVESATTGRRVFPNDRFGVDRAFISQ